MKPYHIPRSLIDKNKGDFVAAVIDAKLKLPKHDELRWDRENITAIKDHKVVAEIVVDEK